MYVCMYVCMRKYGKFRTNINKMYNMENVNIIYKNINPK